MVSRRSFIKSALMGAAAASVSSPFSAFAIDPTGKVLGANDKIRPSMPLRRPLRPTLIRLILLL